MTPETNDFEMYHSTLNQVVNSDLDLCSHHVSYTGAEDPRLNTDTVAGLATSLDSGISSVTGKRFHFQSIKSYSVIQTTLLADQNT